MPTRKTLNFLPAVFQSEANKKFLNATLDQLVTESNLIPISGYVGRKFAPGFSSITDYVREPDLTRADYQLEPGVVYKNDNGTVEFTTSYPEVLQKITAYGGNVANPGQAWSSQYYSYDPHINLDAFVNFGDYYWVPNGPDAVDVYAGIVDLEKTYYPTISTSTGEYNFNGFGVVGNPDIVLARGGTYVFQVNQPGDSFWIQTDPGTSGVQANNINISSRVVMGVTNNGEDKGTVTFAVPQKYAQDFYIDMPVVQNVDYVVTQSYANLQGQTVTAINAAYGGLDGQTSNWAGKFLIFGTYTTDTADWTYNSTTVAEDLRYGIWQIQLNSDGNGDFIVDLVYYAAVPTNQKVIIASGITYGNTQWYKNAYSRLEQIPILTANLDTLYYQNGNNANGVGVIKLVDVGNNTINIETQVLGKLSYISPNGVTFTNGLKVKFDTSVTPVEYQNTEFYVDGVGTGIRLTPVSDLIVNQASQPSRLDPTTKFDGAVTVQLGAAKESLTISTNDVPDGVNVLVGTFPNAANPYYVIEQDLTFTYPYRGALNTEGSHTSIALETGTIGVTVAGIVINAPHNGWYINGTDGTQWHYEAVQANVNGADKFGGSTSSDGKYSYRDSNFITANAWGNLSSFLGVYTESDGHSKLIGFAADGYPIYGPFGYNDPADANSGTTRMRSGYITDVGNPNRPPSQVVTVLANAINANTVTVSSTFGLNPGMRLTVNDGGISENEYWIVNCGGTTAVGPNQYTGGTNQIQLASRSNVSANITVYAGTSLQFEFLPGAFIEDWRYSNNSGATLDRYNGRFCKTPDFPEGTYAYFATQNAAGVPTYPYFIGRAYYGSLDVDVNTTLTTPDYIVINRSSRDLNPWTRRNRWFHVDVINAAGAYNNVVPVLDQDYRAKRPIIEFAPDLQLYNFGKRGLAPVDIFATDSITNAFLQVEGQAGLYVDGISLVGGMRIVFPADTDPTVRNKIWVVNFIDQDSNSATNSIIHLTLAADGVVTDDDTVSVFNGLTNAGKTFWYRNGVWSQGQTKEELNQSPLFDVFDDSGVSFGDRNKYPISDSERAFNGCKIFAYTEGTGVADIVLGFPLSYRNFINIGDIEFTNHFDTDTYAYVIDKVNYTEKVNTGYLHQNDADSGITYLNCWTAAAEHSKQYQDISYIYNGIDNNFLLDVAPAADTVVPNLQVYVNFKLLKTTQYRVYLLNNGKRSIWVDPTLISDGDKIDLLVYSAEISKNGYFQIPDNLNLNPLNQTLETPTLGEMRNHVIKLANRSLIFSGSIPGRSNLRDIEVVQQGGTIVRQSAPATYAAMFITSEKYNFVDSLRYAQQEYTRFKNKFLTLAADGSYYDNMNPITAVDRIMKEINQIKNNTFPWYYSDMIPYGSNKKLITYTVFDPAQRLYQLTEIFSSDTLSNRAVLVYHNYSQMVLGRDYAFLPNSPGIEFTDAVTFAVNDRIDILEFHDTDGCFVPETPTKLGLYPKFVPQIVTDDTYLTPQQFIQGHDGSLTPVFGDFRDNLLLELELRIYNNIKVDYSYRLIDIYNTKPGKFRSTSIDLSNWNRLLGKQYLQWVGFNRLNYTANNTFNVEDPFTFNYGSAQDVVDDALLPGSWRACFDWFYDTTHPHLRPWEMLGFYEEPSWWQDRYGPAPYTSGNKILWDDLEAGYIYAGERQGIDANFARPGLSEFIPVGPNGQLLNPLGLLTTKYYQPNFSRRWAIGQWSPTETAWRNSSEYPFALQYICAMSNPAKYFSYAIQTSGYEYDIAVGEYVIAATNVPLTPADIVVNGNTDDTGAIVRSSGYLNWVTDYQTSLGVLNKTPLANFVNNYNVNLIYRMAGFSSKDRLKVLAEQNSPNSINESIIIPDEDYEILLNKSTPVLSPNYSAVIVEKTTSGFTVSGYNTDNPYFTLVVPQTSGSKQTVTVLDNFVEYYTEFTNTSTSIPYGTEFTTLQQVATFLCGYERWLQIQGFRFDEFDRDLGQIRDWQLSTREFLFWVQQGWTANSVIVLSPVADSIKFVSTNATVDAISNSFYGSRVMNQNFVTLNSDAYTISRDVDRVNTFTLSLDNTNGELLAFINLNVVQYEHALLFNNTTQFNDVIYDPTSGQRQYKLKLVGTKTGGWNGTLSPEGFMYNAPTVAGWRMNTDYLKGDLVEYKNFYYMAKEDVVGTTEFDFRSWLPVDKDRIKTGLINNFATNAGLGVDFYDTDLVNLESEYDLYSLGLIGYRNRSYLNDLGLNDTSQVKFYQGFIKQKGTRNAIDALGRISLALNEQSSVNINEEWAFNVGNYGAVDTNRFVELVLDEAYTLSNPTSLQTYSNGAVTYSSLYTSAGEVYKTATTPWTSPFLLNRSDDSNRSDDIQTAGFVHIEDVDYTLFDLADIQTLNSSADKIGIGSTIWVALNYERTWDVYKVTGTAVSAVNFTNALNNRVLVTVNTNHTFAVDDIILINNVDQFTGFYKIVSIPNINSFIIEFLGSLAGFSSQNFNSAPIYKLESQRYDYASDIPDNVDNYWQVNANAWVDTDTTTGEWAVYKKTEPWVIDSALQRTSYTINGQMGSSVKLSSDNRFAIVGQPGVSGTDAGLIINYLTTYDGSFVEGVVYDSSADNTVNFGSSIDNGDDYVVVGAPGSNSSQGYAFIYSRNVFGALSKHQILAPNTANAVEFGSSVTISADDQWIYVGAPGGDAVYVYGYYALASQEVETLTANANANVSSFSLSFTPVSTEILNVADDNKDYVPYVDYTIDGDVIEFTFVPANDITVRQAPGYILADVIEYANSGSRFGHSIATSTDGRQVLVGAPLDTTTTGNISLTDAGSISVYDRSVDSWIATGGTLFGGFRGVGLLSKVYVGEELQTLGVDYTIAGGSYVQFGTAPVAGALVTIETNVFNKIITAVTPAPQAGAQFGYSVDICTNNCSLYVGAPYYTREANYNEGVAYRLVNQGKLYGSITGTVENPVVNSGDSIRINDFTVEFTSTSLASVVSAINAANIPGVTAENVSGYLKINSSSVIAANKLRILPSYGTALVDLGLDVFVCAGQIANPTAIPYDKFGFAIKVNELSNIVAVGSPTATTIEETTFDLNSTVVDQTVFDSDSTTFHDTVQSGAVWTFAYLGDNRQDVAHPGKFSFVQQLTPSTLDFSLVPNVQFGYSLDVNDFTMLVGAPGDSSFVPNGGRSYKFTNTSRLTGWDVNRAQESKVDIDALSKIYVYNKDTNTILYNLDYIDPAKGKILGVAEQDLTYKTTYDPAIYNNSTNSELSSSNTFYWNNSQVGQVWWDLSAVRYIDYEQGSVKYRTTNWGRTFPGSSIEVYEWVESLYPPSRYVAAGGDGVPKYSDDSAYVTLEYIDAGTGTATVKYYFWVKGRTTVSNSTGSRKIPTSTIANYIRDPKDSGIQYMAALRDDAVAVYNLQNEPSGQSVILHIDYSTQLNSNIIHSEYALLAETGTNPSLIPNTIYSKLVDSVSGVDMFGNPVPDPTLPVQSRYGISIRPRQGMFVDRSQAIKEMVAYVNTVFAENIISQGFDLSTLSAGDPIPAQTATIVLAVNGATLGVGDYTIEVIGDVSVITFNTTVPANSVLGISYNGSEEFVNILEATDTYNYSGYLTANTYDITVANIEELGYINPIILADGYKVLVLNDSTVDNYWTIYVKQDDDTWLLEQVQSFRTSDYWGYTDWYAAGFDQTSRITYTVDTYADMNRLRIRAGDVVKVNNNGQGNWVLLQVYPNTTVTVGVENGTIALSESLYKTEEYGIGFGNDNFDSKGYDQNPSLEIRNILSALRNDIFVDRLNQQFMDLFFVFVYYILDEQKYVDWVFKTSFINVLHKIKRLGQPPIYSKETQDYYKQYIEEVKPYHTTIREYVVDYESVDNVHGYATDFDVPAYYDNSLKLYRSPSGEYASDAAALQGVQYRDWVTNYTYTVGSIEIANGGSGYTVAPQVTITGSAIGNEAVARALISNGVVSRIEVLYGGSNYITQPTVALSGGNGTGARAYALLSNETVRKVKTTLVYDRITYGTEVLEWSANTSYTQGSIVAHNGTAYIVDRNFTSGSTFIGNDLTIYPAYNFKAANDRIQAYYDPATGLPGKNFGLLQSGIDYPGVRVEGPLYTESGGFDVSPFDSSPYDPVTLDADGTLVISDALLDAKIESLYTDSYLGTRPEDVVVDGGAYVDTYSSHAPEELVPGAVFDTLDMTISTMALFANTAAYTSWVSTTAFYVSEIIITDPGAGYVSGANVVIVDVDGNVDVSATAAATTNANGNVTAISVLSAGVGYTTIPTVVITGSNTRPATASVRLRPYDFEGNAVGTFEYRIFKDMRDSYSYLRLDNVATTTLAANLSLEDTEIVVTDSSVLFEPDITGVTPGVVFIDGERITYWKKFDSNNTLGQIRRGTLGTGASEHVAGAEVVSGSLNQRIPYSSNFTWTPNVDTVLETTASQYYTFNAGTEYIRSKLWYKSGLLPIELATESGTYVTDLITAANIIANEANVGITTEGGNTNTPSVTNGNGLYAATSIQATFIKDN